MIKGVGIDIIEIDRLAASVKKHGNSFLKKIYSARELAYCCGRFPELAARFAAKEAYAKAIGTGMAGISWRQIEVVKNKKGQPLLSIKGKILKKAHLSLSHSRDYAVASVYVEK